MRVLCNLRLACILDDQCTRWEETAGVFPKETPWYDLGMEETGDMIWFVPGLDFKCGTE